MVPEKDSLKTPMDLTLTLTGFFSRGGGGGGGVPEPFIISLIKN